MTKTPRIKLRHIIPSVVTVFAICAGLTSVRMSLEGHLEIALFFVLLAVFLDAADGKLARFLDTASPFGAELDSLADFFNFGIAPGILLYNALYLGTLNANLGWVATLVLAVCCALRLARFNLSLKGPSTPLKKDNFFIGVPAPALGSLALMPIFMHLSGWENVDYPVLRTLYIISIGLLAVSTIPTFSIKHASIKRNHLAFAIIGAVIMVIGLMTYPWPTLVVLNLLYLSTIPFSYFAELKTRQGLGDANLAD